MGRSRRGGHTSDDARPSCVELKGREGLEHPTSVRYTCAASGKIYEVDVVAMQQISTETGRVRKVERKSARSWQWANDKKEFIRWCQYPSEVIELLERVHSVRNGGSITLESRMQDLQTNERWPTQEASTSEDLLALERGLPDTGCSPETLRRAKDLALETATHGQREVAIAAAFLKRLAANHGLCCTIADARHAGIVVGSMALLEAVLASNPTLGLMGFEIFDRKYTSLQLNDQGRKDCIRCLLARGMVLGASAPQSKLLRKVEADSVPLWIARYLDSMMIACPAMPETVRAKVEPFLSATC